MAPLFGSDAVIGPTQPIPSSREIASMIPREILSPLSTRLWWLGQWGWRGLLVGVLVGLAVAGFHWSLDRVTTLFWAYPSLLWALPALGWLGARLYERLGGESTAGTNLILDQIHEPGGGVPLRMAPLVFLGTLLTHLGGGSAGREGTAVQMGGGIAGGLARWLDLRGPDLSRLLMTGVAAGFGAVFGTPLAGTIFAMEVLTQGQIRHAATIPCLIAACVGNLVVHSCGISHTPYVIEDWSSTSVLDGWIFAKVCLASVMFGLTSVLFVRLTHMIQHLLATRVSRLAMRPVVAAVAIWVLVMLVGSRDYLGLGVSPNPVNPQGVTLQSCFHEGGATTWSWIWKLIFTAVTVGGGLRGGEVTPLFFMGTALGNATAGYLNAPVGLLAALGFVAVFAGAAKTPLACTVMAVELFVLNQNSPSPAGLTLLAAFACHISWSVSGIDSIFSRQRTLPAELSAPPSNPM
jgi:H+/Cl- antiporter ClcA